MNPNLILLYPMVARALEIALAGNHSLRITGEDIAALKIIEQHAPRCLRIENKTVGEDAQIIVEAERFGGARAIAECSSRKGDPIEAWNFDSRDKVMGRGLANLIFTDEALDVLSKYEAVACPTLAQTVNTVEVSRTIAILSEKDQERDAPIIVGAKHIHEAAVFTMPKLQGKGASDGTI